MVLLLTFVQVPIGDIGAQPPLPEAIVQKLANALNTGDVASALAQFDRRAVISLIPSVRPGFSATITGAEILKWLSDLHASHIQIKLEIVATHGNIVITNTSTSDDQTTALGVAPLIANEIYVIQNGQIRAMTWVLSDDSLKKLTAASLVPLPGPFKVADILGTWSWRNGDYYLQLKTDGTYAADEQWQNLDTPQDSGQFQFDGKVLTMTSGSGTRLCKSGDMGVTELALTRGGQLQMTAVPQKLDPCELRRAPSSEPELMDRVPDH